MSGTVLVTGAGGFIGRHTCQSLIDAGWTVRAAVRTTDPPPGTAACRRPLASDRVALRTMLARCDAVVHLAGRAHVLRESATDTSAEFHASNVELTRAVAEAALAEGVRAFVFMSSIAAVSNARSRCVSDESTDAPDTDYGVSKREAEGALSEVARGTPLRAVALRAPMVFGEGMRGNPLTLFKYLARGLPLPVVRPAVKRSVMYVGNLAGAVVAALRQDRMCGPFCVSDGEPVTIDDFARAVAAALDRRARLVPVPSWALQLGGRIGEVAGRAVPVPVNRAGVARLAQSLVVDGTRFAALAEFTPAFSQREGVERTARWIRGRMRESG